MVGSMTQQAVKIRENRLRRMAERQGLQLVKARRRDPQAVDYGCYGIVSRYAGAPLLAFRYVEGPWSMGLDDVEAWLTAPKQDRGPLPGVARP
jgi:hypothetical protein